MRVPNPDFALRDWRRHLFRPVDIASLVYFRIGFGLIMLWDIYEKLIRPGYLRYWQEPYPVMYFKWYGFSWVGVSPYWDIELHLWALGICLFFIIIGFLYRISMFLFFIGWTYTYLVDMSLFQNHYYFISWVSFAMIFVSANASFSVDACLRKSIRANVTPAWTVAILAGLMGIVYCFGGLAKINSDWLQGFPMCYWLEYDLGDFGRQEWLIYLMAYSGMLMDLLALPFLLWRKSRPYMFGLLVMFHCANKFMFGVGIFPWLSIAITAMFFSPSWPRLWINWVSEKIGKGKVWLIDQKSLLYAPIPLTSKQRCTVALLAICLVFHLLFPLRWMLYGGNPNWTEEGQCWSWRMKLRQKTAVHFLDKDILYPGHFKVKGIRLNPETGKQSEYIKLIDINNYLLPYQATHVTIRPFGSTGASCPPI